RTGTVRCGPPPSAISCLIPVLARRLAERDRERSEPGLEVLPLLKSAAEDRLADLLGARRAHAALGLMKRHALRLELQAAEIEHAPHAALKIIDDVLVEDAQDAPRQHAIPMAHQLKVGAVVTRDVLDAVGEFLAVREQLLEIAETTGHRLAPRIDDARIG